jgi:hypothetical protein
MTALGVRDAADSHCEFSKQSLYRHIPARFLVLRLLHLTRAAFAQSSGDFVMCECLPDHGHKSLRAELTSMLSGDSWGQLYAANEVSKEKRNPGQRFFRGVGADLRFTAKPADMVE